MKCIKILFCNPVKKTIDSKFTKIDAISMAGVHNIHTAISIEDNFCFLKIKTVVRFLTMLCYGSFRNFLLNYMPRKLALAPFNIPLV